MSRFPHARTRPDLGCARLALLALAACMLIWAGGCGRKGPPVAPRDPAPPPVTDLSVSVAQDTAVLNWRVAAVPDDGLPDGYHIYRARIGPETCEGCPLMFQKIGALDLDRSERPAQGSWSLTWRDRVEPGFRYVYKVTALRGRERVADSNLAATQP